MTQLPDCVSTYHSHNQTINTAHYGTCVIDEVRVVGPAIVFRKGNGPATSDGLDLAGLLTPHNLHLDHLLDGTFGDWTIGR
jgi:hypothetical protein